MTRRTLIAAAVIAAAPVLTGFACVPTPPPKPQCGPYSAVHEGRPMPCVQGPGDRVDIIMSGPVTPASSAAVRNAAVARCNAIPGGRPGWSDSVVISQRVLVCWTTR